MNTRHLVMICFLLFYALLIGWGLERLSAAPIPRRQRRWLVVLLYLVPPVGFLTIYLKTRHLA